MTRAADPGPLAFIQSVTIALLILTLCYPVLRALVRHLNDYSSHRPLPRPFWSREARTAVTTKPRRPYDWATERNRP